MINQKDIKVLACLRQNPRQTLKEMSKATQVPISTIYDRIKYFEKSIVTRHTTIIDFSKLGFHTRAHIALKVSKEQREDMKEFLTKHLNINSVFKINNGYDFLVECVFRNIKELEEFLEHMENQFKVKQREVYYLVDELKRESFLADKRYAEYVTNVREPEITQPF